MRCRKYYSKKAFSRGKHFLEQINYLELSETQQAIILQRQYPCYRIFVCKNCSIQCFICSTCDRSNIYCKNCAPECKEHSNKNARKKYRQSEHGKNTRNIGSKRYREKKINDRVGHQGSTSQELLAMPLEAGISSAKKIQGANCENQNQFSNLPTLQKGEKGPIICAFCQCVCLPFSKTVTGEKWRSEKRKNYRQLAKRGNEHPLFSGD